MTEQAPAGWQCPKDGIVMQPMGRRGRRGAWRCPDCRAIFLDTESLQRGRRDRSVQWAPVVASVVMSLLLTFVVRRLRRRPSTTTPS